MLNAENATQDETENLTIPAFLDKRNKVGSPQDLGECIQILANSKPPEAAPEPEITLDMVLEQIKKLSVKRDEIQATLSGLKKQAQKMVGSL